ncbi:MAG: cytochrome ubiquinol oxidase subunit I [Chloroflexi bacterium]|nr:cytochrome ubiquinol oxidase subunit I [Chloroflexota bacterium]
MDALALARLQFAVTTVYHFFFVPLTLGLSILVAIMHTLYYRSGDETWKQMTQFWGQLFLINFAMGVVTGIVQEFQFGMNWSEYSRFVGDIFGAPLAIEALLAFFLESTFLGVWFFGWDKLPKRVHLASIWLVAIGSNLSALWILIANSFMQEPVGYVLRNGRAEMTDFVALATNPNIWVQFPHVLTSGITTAAFFVLGISAWHLLRKQNVAFFRRAFQLATVYAVVGTVLVILIGHSQAQHMVQTQPMKMASAEALYQTEDPASFSLLTIGDLSQRRQVFAIRIPDLLSLLAYNQFTGKVEGINDLDAAYKAQYASQYGPNADYVPPVAFIYWSFRGMVGAGFLMAFLALVGLYLVLRDKFENYPLFLRVLPWAILLPYLANTTGWLMTELGRQPWIVFGLMRVQDAVSPAVPGWEVLLSLILFTAIYGALMVVDVYLLRKYSQGDPTSAPVAVAEY